MKQNKQNNLEMTHSGGWEKNQAKWNCAVCVSLICLSAWLAKNRDHSYPEKVFKSISKLNIMRQLQSKSSSNCLFLFSEISSVITQVICVWVSSEFKQRWNRQHFSTLFNSQQSGDNGLQGSLKTLAHFKHEQSKLTNALALYSTTGKCCFI